MILLESYQTVRDNPYATRQRQETLRAIVDFYDRQHRPAEATSTDGWRNKTPDRPLL